MNTNGQAAATSHKRKNIIFSAIALVVIIIVGFWAISAAINAGSHEPNDILNPEIATTEDNKETPQTQSGTNVPSPAEQYNNAETTNESTVVIEQNAMPTTGPAEVIFSAIMLGIVAYLVALNVNLVKENQ